MTQRSKARIAMDVMGGDFGPSVTVPGIVDAARQLNGRADLVVVGDEKLIIAELKAAGCNPSDFEIVHAPSNIEMGESPASAIRKKTDSPIVVSSHLMKDGKVDAFVSAGSTGAAVAGSLLIAGRLPGVARPAIATPIPTERGIALVLDAGANADCRPQHLLQFAAMGRIYAESVLGVEKVKVGLLNIGEEPGKGNELTQGAYKLLKAHEKAFIGNIESKDLFQGKADIIITDGFVGNIVLKMVESFGGFLMRSFQDEIKGNPRAKTGAWLMKPAVIEYGKRFNYVEYGGAPLLGCNGLTIICHGSSNALAICNAAKVAEKGVRDRISHRIQEEIEREQAELEAAEAQLKVDSSNAKGAQEESR